MEAPEYLICVSCETPCYDFEWQNGELAEAMCMACGEDDLEAFLIEEEYEAMTAG